MPNEPINVFISYSHNAEDNLLREKLLKQLSPLQRGENPLIKIWDDTHIRAGEAWDNAIKGSLANAQIVLLLISADFNASDYIYEIEMKTAFTKHESGECKVLPIYLRDCHFESMPYAQFEMLPKDPSNQRLKSVNSWENPDSAFTILVRRIEEVAKSLQKVNSIFNENEISATITTPKSEPKTVLNANPISDLERNGFLSQINLITSKLQRLQTALILETDASRIFAYEHEVSKLETQLLILKEKVKI
jgi:hypothetical protein